MIININSFRGTKFISSISDSLKQNLKEKLIPVIEYDNFIAYNLPFGKIVSSSLNTGLTIILSEFIYPYPPFIIEFNSADSDTPYKVGFVSKGSYSIQYKSENFKQEITEDTNLIITPQNDSQLITESARNLKFLYIFISPVFLNSYFNIENKQLQFGIRNNSSDFLFKKGVNSPQINLILSELFNYNFQSNLSNLYLESKSLELLTLFFQQFVVSENNFTSYEKDTILNVHQYIISNLSYSHTVKELISYSGLNEHKLQNGFKTIFGTTIQRHIKKLKLQEAKRLILQENNSVSEAGFKVGYTNMSHFATAFRQEYGVLPKELK